MQRVVRRRSLVPLLSIALLACGPTTDGGAGDRLPPAFDLARASPAPGATDVDPREPIVLPFVPGECADCGTPCDVDAASLEGKVALTPAPFIAPTVSLDVTACALVVRVPGGLPPLSSCRLDVLAGIRDVAGNATEHGLELSFTTAARDTTDTRAPTFVGSWPAPGDERVGRRTPLTLFFDEEVVAPAVVSGAPALLQRAKPASWSLELAPADGWPTGLVTLTVSGVADAAGNRSTRAWTVPFRVTSSDDGRAPVFVGVREAFRERNTVVLRWEAAQDDTSPAAKVRYLVHMGAPDEPLGALPVFVTAPGQLEARLAAPSGPVAVRVRAQDEAGNVDGNERVEVVP